MSSQGVDIPIRVEGNALQAAEAIEKRFKSLEGQLNQVGIAAQMTTGKTSALGGGLKSMGGGLKGAAGGAGALATGLAQVSMEAARFAATLAGSAIKEASAFEAQMTRVAAITDRSTANLELFQRAATTAALQSAFTAREAGGALEFMAMAGMNAATSTAALPEVMALAAASGEDLAKSADILTNIMTGYGKTAADLSKVNDVLVATFTSSNVSLAQLGTTMRYVGPIAKTSGQDFEQIAAAVGLMGNAGIQGTMAGRTLRTSLIRLQDPTRQAKEALEELGVVTKDSSGKMFPLVDILTQLRDAGANTAQLSRIFGKESVAGMTALLEQGPERLRLFADQLERSDGLARRIERLQLDTVQGQFQILTGSVQTLGAQAGAVVDGPLKQMLVTFNLTTLANDELTRELERMGRALDEGSGHIMQLTRAFTVASQGVLVDTIADLRGFVEVSLSMSAAAMEIAKVSFSLGGLIDATTGARVALSGLKQVFVPWLNTLELIGRTYRMVKGETEAFSNATDQLTKDLEELERQRAMQRLADSAAALGDRFRRMGDDVRLGALQMGQALESLGTYTFAWLTGDTQGMVESLSLEEQAWHKRVEAAKATTEQEAIRLKLQADILKLKSEEISEAQYEARELELIAQAEAKIQSLRQARNRSAEQARKKRQEDERRRQLAEIEYQRLLATHSATRDVVGRELAAQAEREAALAKVALDVSQGRLNAEEQRLELLKIERTFEDDLFSIQMERVRLQQEANDAELRAIQERLREQQKIAEMEMRLIEMRMAKSQSPVFDDDEFGPAPRPPTLAELQARRLSRNTFAGEALAVSTADPLRQGLEGSQREMLDPLTAELEALNDMDTSRLTDVERMAHEQRVAQIEARIEAIQRENDQLLRQIDLYEQIGKQTGQLATALGELAANQWDFGSATDSVNSALAAGSAILGASLEAAGVGIKEQAKWKAAFETAAAIAAAAGAISLANPALAGAAVQHGVAAAQFGLIASGVIGSSSGAGAAAPARAMPGSTGFERDDFRSRADRIRSEGAEARPVVINVDFGNSIHSDGYDQVSRVIRDAANYDGNNRFDLAGGG